VKALTCNDTTPPYGGTVPGCGRRLLDVPYRDKAGLMQKARVCRYCDGVSHWPKRDTDAKPVLV